MPSRDAKTGKGERTRQRIVAAALELFREHGYEATTMRMVAERAEVSLGNAYYYYRSKELLLHAFYAEIQAAHVAACEAVLARETKLLERLRGVLLAHLEVIEPYHRFSGLLFRTAADPESPLNPFHSAGDQVRRNGETIYATALEGAKAKIPRDFAAHLPGLLWTYQMGIVLFWIHDTSEDRQRTRALIEQTAELVVSMIKLSSNPLLRPLRQRTLKLLNALRSS